MHTKPHWKPDIDFSSCRFIIRRLDASNQVKTADIPVARLPMIGFIYVTSGEVLVEADGNPYLCQPGHVLIIPAQCPFSICYYHDATGYTGGFNASALTDARALRYITAPLHQAFWFDEGVFMSELFNMLLISFEKKDQVFIEKALDLFLSRIKSGQSPVIPDTVNRFLESVFNPDNDIKTLSSYAIQAGISENYLSRQIKQHTGRSVGAWIDIVRTIRAKKLLADSSVPIIDVAAAVGLDDQSYFARFFKRQTGMTPSEFRKVMQG
jgi:AraC-like DNA-binding protein